MWGSGFNLQELVLTFHCVGHGNQTQVVRFGHVSCHMSHVSGLVMYVFAHWTCHLTGLVYLILFWRCIYFYASVWVPACMYITYMSDILADQKKAYIPPHWSYRRSCPVGAENLAHWSSAGTASALSGWAISPASKASTSYYLDLYRQGLPSPVLEYKPLLLLVSPRSTKIVRPDVPPSSWPHMVSYQYHDGCCRPSFLLFLARMQMLKLYLNPSESPVDVA